MNGTRRKDALEDPKASVRRIIKDHGLGFNEAAMKAIVDNRFFSNYFVYERPSPELVAALRCDADVSAIDYDGR
jgi:hypothetical protein